MLALDAVRTTHEYTFIRDNVAKIAHQLPRVIIKSVRTNVLTISAHNKDKKETKKKNNKKQEFIYAFLAH